jgi:hypothetical protein
MTRVYSSVREAYIAFLLGEVEEDDSLPSTSSSYTKLKRAASFPPAPASTGMVVVKGAQAI